MNTILQAAVSPMASVLTMRFSGSEFIEKESLSPPLLNYDYKPEEAELVYLIIGYRHRRGLQPLEVVNHISAKCEQHNEYMIQKNVVNYDFFEERSQDMSDVLGSVKVSENLAYNFPTPNAVMQAWLKSDEHRSNIEGDFTHFGISIRENPESGKKYYTNIFIKI